MALAAAWYWVVEPSKSVVRVLNVYSAITQISLTTLRNIIGRHTLDDVLKEKDKLSEEMRRTIDDVTEPWGVQVQMVEMKDVVIPESNAAGFGSPFSTSGAAAIVRSHG